MDKGYEEIYTDDETAELLITAGEREIPGVLESIAEEFKERAVKVHTYNDDNAGLYREAGYKPSETDLYFVCEAPCTEEFKREYPPVDAEGYTIHFDMTEYDEDSFTESVALADADGTVAGGCLLDHDADSACISQVFIREDKRRTGLATRLIREVIRRCPGKTLILHTDSFNPHAVALYKKCGFTVRERLYSYTLEK